VHKRALGAKDACRIALRQCDLPTIRLLGDWTNRAKMRAEVPTHLLSQQAVNFRRDLFQGAHLVDQARRSGLQRAVGRLPLY
jgi:hypothetical protein